MGVGRIKNLVNPNLLKLEPAGLSLLLGNRNFPGPGCPPVMEIVDPYIYDVNPDPGPA